MVRAVYSKLAAQHRNPVPNAAILRGLLVTSGILGKRLDTDDYPADRGEQTALVFSYLEAIEEAGAHRRTSSSWTSISRTSRTGPSPMNSGFACGPTRPAPGAPGHRAVLPDGCCLQIVAMALLPQR